MPETYLLSLIGSLVLLLLAIIGWGITRAYSQLLHLGTKVEEISTKLHDRVTNISNRITAVEATCRVIHKLKD